MGRVNPATGEKLDSIDQHTDEDVDAVLSRATETFEEWRTVPITEREQLIEQVAEILRKNEDEYAELMTKEMAGVQKVSHSSTIGLAMSPPRS